MWDVALLVGIILLVMGFVLAGVEMVTPGFAVAGISAIVCFVASIIILTDTIKQAIILALIILAISSIMFAVILTLLSKGKISRKLVLTDELNKEKGYVSSDDLDYLQGKKGIANTDLRPTGVGEFDGKLMDVLSEGSFVTKGTPIRVYKVEGSKIIIRVENNLNISKEV